MDHPYQGFRFGVHEFTCESAISLLEAVSAANERGSMAGLKLTALDLIELGAAYVNDQRILNPSLALRKGDRLRIHTSPRRFIAPTDLAARLVSESSDVLVIEKPAGLPVEPTVDNVRENLLSFLEDLRGQRFYLVHRLEAESEGLVLVAKSAEAAARASRAFAEGLVKRTYAAYVSAPIATVGLENDFPMTVLRCDERVGRTNVITEGRSTYEIQGPALERFFRLEIELTRGRPQRVRETLAELGAPIIGDAKNGSAITLLDSVTRKPVLAFRVTQFTLD